MKKLIILLCLFVCSASAHIKDIDLMNAIEELDDSAVADILDHNPEILTQSKATMRIKDLNNVFFQKNGFRRKIAIIAGFAIGIGYTLLHRRLDADASFLSFTSLAAGTVGYLMVKNALTIDDKPYNNILTMLIKPLTTEQINLLEISVRPKSIITFSSPLHHFLWSLLGFK